MIEVPSNHTRIGAWVNSRIVGEKTTSILYNSINRHVGISHKNRRNGNKLGLQLYLNAIVATEMTFISPEIISRLIILTPQSLHTHFHSLLCSFVFFTLTDRALTTPSNIRGCQSGTWSAGQKKIR